MLISFISQFAPIFQSHNQLKNVSFEKKTVHIFEGKVVGSRRANLRNFNYFDLSEKKKE